MTRSDSPEMPGDNREAWEASNRTGANAGLVWGVAVAALLLTAAFLVALFSRPVYARSQLIGLMIPAVPGALSALLVLIGVAMRHGLAYRFGVVFGPIGAGWLLLGSVFIFRYLGTPGTAVMLAIVALGIATPVLWTRPGAKRYFGLCCPACGGLRIGAESMTLSERRCAACNTVFRDDGQILAWGGGYAAAPGQAWPVQPESSSVQPQPVTTAPPTSPGPLGGVPILSYAGLHRGLPAGPPGVERRTIWYIVCTVILLLASGAAFVVAISLATVSTQTMQVPPPPPPATPPPPTLVAATSSTDPSTTVIILLAIIIVAWLSLIIYWLVWIGLIHGEMRRFTAYDYKISPAKAVGFCFIPLFNLFWLVYMPYEMARTLPRYLGFKPGSDRSTLVLVFQLLGMILWMCLNFPPILFFALTMYAIQSVLNDLWRTVRANAPAGPMLEPALVAAGAGQPGAPVAAMAQSGFPVVAMPAYAPPIEEDASMRMLLPVGRSGWAIAAGYLGLLSPLVLPAPPAIITAIMAFRDMRRHPEKHGMGRAIFGLVAGGIVTLIALVGAVAVIIEELR